jgi:hypothetical protein
MWIGLTGSNEAKRRLISRQRRHWPGCFANLGLPVTLSRKSRLSVQNEGKTADFYGAFNPGLSRGSLCFLAGFRGSEKANLKSGHHPQNTIAKAWQLLNILWRFNAPSGFKILNDKKCRFGNIEKRNENSRDTRG